MTIRDYVLRAVVIGTLLVLGPPSQAAEYPAPKEAVWVARDFRFHTGEVMPELRVNYTTVGDPAGEPVLVLHGTGGSGTGGKMVVPASAAACACGCMRSSAISRRSPLKASLTGSEKASITTIIASSSVTTSR